MKNGNKFFGPDKILSVEKLEHQTPAKGSVIRATFEDGEYVVMGEKVFQKLCTQKPVAATDFFYTKTKAMYPLFASIMLEFGIPFGEMPMVIGELTKHTLDVFEKAESKLWTGTDNLFISQTSGKHARSIMEADIILTKDESKN